MCQKTVGNIYINKRLSISCSWAIIILDGHLPADHFFSLISQDHSIMINLFDHIHPLSHTSAMCRPHIVHQKYTTRTNLGNGNNTVNAMTAAMYPIC